jgi:valyl-tRNA synthetase
MSKSKGNVVTPEALLDENSSDAVRYWAARARLGVDTAFDAKLFAIGKRLATKIFNASRFVLLQLERQGAGTTADAASITHPLDRAFAARLGAAIERATAAFEEFDYAGALQTAEETFWDFCDNYLELVKARSYSEQDSAARRSATATLLLGLRAFLRLFAPFLPFVTEEVWSWRFAGAHGGRSIHTAPWPRAAELGALAPQADADAYAAAVEIGQKIRGAKTAAKRSLRWGVTRLSVRGSAADLEALRAALDDVLASGAVEDGAVRLSEGEAPAESRFHVEVELASQAS